MVYLLYMSHTLYILSKHIQLTTAKQNFYLMCAQLLGKGDDVDGEKLIKKWIIPDE